MICHDHKCIFVHIERTGGTSIELTLSGFDWWIKATQDQKHLSAAGCIDRYGGDTWRRYFTFTFVRNPWDLVVSSYFFFHERKRTGLSFRDFVLTPDEPPGAPEGDGQWTYARWWRRFGKSQFDWISDRAGNVLVDRIGRFERLEDDFVAMCQRIGVAPPRLVHESRMRHLPYAAYYDDVTRLAVAERFRRDIETFEYEFGQ